jgi:hypothetical protein
MELGLKKENYEFYDTRHRLYGTHEETHEAIVTDAQPDILRIVSSHGSVFLSSHDIQGDKAEMSGSVKAEVLYLPENGTGIEHIAVSIPFSHHFEIKDCGADSVALCGAEIQAVDARTINPRKIMIRCTIKLCVKIIEPRTLELSRGVEQPNNYGINMLKESYTAKLMCAAGTKAFGVTDEFELPPTKPAAKEIIKWTMAMHVTDQNTIGRKIVYKGLLDLSMLYKSVSDEICSHQTEIPFSQIIELDGMRDNAECVIRIQPENGDLVIRNEQERTMAFSIGAEAQAEAYLTEKLDAVCDLYSTAMKSAIDIKPHVFSALKEKLSRRQTIRDNIEADMEVKKVDDMEVMFEPVVIDRENGGVKISSMADVRVLFTGEDGLMYSLQKKMRTEVWVEAEEDTVVSASVNASAFASNPAAMSGVEVRFDSCFDIDFVRRQTIMAVDSAKLTEHGEDSPARPSVVLRYPGAGESLWSMAKRYNTTEADIREANDLEADEMPSLTDLLLIPKRR